MRSSLSCLVVNRKGFGVRISFERLGENLPGHSLDVRRQEDDSDVDSEYGVLRRRIRNRKVEITAIVGVFQLLAIGLQELMKLINSRSII